MTHQDECPAIDDLTALLIEHGLAAMESVLGTHEPQQCEQPKGERHRGHDFRPR